MSTKREQILTAMTTKLKTLTNFSDSIFRSRMSPFIRDEFPAISVEFVTDTPDQASLPAPIITWAMLIAVRVFTKADPENSLTPDEVADPIIQAAHALIVSDLSLGGLTMDIQPAAVKNELFDGDLDTGIISMNYLVQYRTTTVDLT